MGERRLGNRLKEVRTAQGLTQTDLAVLVGVSRKTINTVENAIFVPSTILALTLAKTLDTTVEHLFFVITDGKE
jgi:putative transcriptional regulator